jgi:hypothetical protein
MENQHAARNPDVARHLRFAMLALGECARPGVVLLGSGAWTSEFSKFIYVKAMRFRIGYIFGSFCALATSRRLHVIADL